MKMLLRALAIADQAASGSWPLFLVMATVANRP